jgi:hypothetical protein
MATKINTTKNYMLEFKGWAQGRIPTDPDPSNDPRGVTGYTFALPGEPDLDRIIYFQQKNGVIRRSHCPAVGVFVTGGYEFVTHGQGGEVEFVSKTPIIDGHPLYKATVDLLGNATFDSRNSTLIYNGFGIVNPFALSIEGEGISINRRFYADSSNEQDNLESYNINTLNSYMMNTVIPNSLEVILGTDVLDRTAFRNERLKLLQKDLAVLREEELKHPNHKPVLVQIAALEKRIAELKMNDPVNRRTNQIGTQVLINYPLNATTASVNNKKITPPVQWPTMVWLGGWDADAMGFNVNGFVQIILAE